MSNYRFSEKHVKLPAHDADVIITFPGGQQMTIQARPCSADGVYNGSLDIILHENHDVITWKGDHRDPSHEVTQGKYPHIRRMKQMVTELPDGYEQAGNSQS